MKTDMQLKQDVIAELGWEPSVNAAQIGVEVSDGVVTLAGHVGSYAEKVDAERAAQRVAGVKALAIEMDVTLPAWSKRTDADIARSAENALQWTTYLPKPDSVKVMVESGWITLSGDKGKSMENENSSVYVFNTHMEAEEAIRSLSRSGFDVKKLSLVGKGYHSEEHPVGFYTAGDRIKSWGGTGAFWGALWGLLFAPAVFFLPGLGLVAMAGPVVPALIGALEGAVVVGGLSALGATLTTIGVPKDQVIRYETALKADKYVLVVHGSSEEVAKARAVLESATVWETA